jgi:hypothetical protein
MPQMLTVECHRRRGHLIGGKDSGDRTADFGDDQRKVEQAGFLDAAMHAGGAKAQWRRNASGVVLAHADVCIAGWGRLGIGGRGA